MMLKKTYFCLVLFCLPRFACAYDYFISISAGPGWTSPGKTQTLVLSPDVIKTYVPENLASPHVLVDGEIFFGIQQSYFKSVESQFGLDLYASSPVKLKGFIQEDGDPNFQNYTYRYKISHEHLALKTQWIFENAMNVNPYVSASLGAGLNHSFGYSVSPLISQEVAAPPFQNKTQIALSYAIGAGFQQNINQHFAVALGYQLVSFGKSSLSHASGQTSGKALALQNVYTQNLELTISYFL